MNEREKGTVDSENRNKKIINRQEDRQPSHDVTLKIFNKYK